MTIFLVAGTAPAAARQQADARAATPAQKTGVEQIRPARAGRAATTTDIPQVSQARSMAQKGIPAAAPIGGRDRCDPSVHTPTPRDMLCRPDVQVSRHPAEPSSPNTRRVSSLVETLADETGRSSGNIDDTAGAIAILGFPNGGDPPARR
ncbi:hypothetical protein NPJ82_09030 [Sphingomonas sp. NY01]|uniref:hypothetical protein n=1 Tax=Sphingomonas sp. NY01 TaxID=2968057 RepID=UPI00315CA784